MFNLIKTAHAEGTNLGDLLPYDIGKVKSVGELFTKLEVPGFSIAGLIMLVYFVYAAVKLIIAGDNKEQVSEAKAMITHSIIGILLLLFLFLVIEYLPRALGVGIYLTGK